MNPDMFTIGPITIKWYSFMILVGILIAFGVATLEEKRKQFPKDFVIDLGFWLIIFGMAGARIWYVLFNLDFYLAHPDQIIAVWNGGLAIHGGIIAGIITLVVFCSIKKINILKACDLAAPSLIIAQAIGRWGNFFNSEAHGPLTTLAVLQQQHIPQFVIDGMYINGHYYLPTFFYESLWCIAGFIILMIIRYVTKKHSIGLLTGGYLFWYGIGRLIIESLRTDSLMLGNIKIAQLISVIFISIGLGLIIFSIIYNLINFIKEKEKVEDKVEPKKKTKKVKQG